MIFVVCSTFCRLDDDMLVKVADFGLSRDIYESDYYSSDDRKAKLPVKWMALESLEKGIYSTRTDVVSEEKAEPSIGWRRDYKHFLWSNS